MTKDFSFLFCAATLCALLSTIAGAVFPAAREISNIATIYFALVAALSVAVCVAAEIFSRDGDE